MKWKDGVVYANAVAKGNLNVCRNVTLACQRFLNALENKSWEWQFDPKAVQHVLDFAGLMLHVKGPWANSRVQLQPFQILIICAIYGFWHKRQKIRRMTQDVIVFVPRKAGKSTLIAILAIYELMFGEAGSEVLTLATNREQASIVFQAASGLIDTLPASVRKKYNCGKHQITKVGDTQSVFRASCCLANLADVRYTTHHLLVPFLCLHKAFQAAF